MINIGIVDLGLSIFPETRRDFPCAFTRLCVLFQRCLIIDDCGSALFERMNMENASGKKEMIKQSSIDVATFMLEQIKKFKILYQQVVVQEIHEKFGDDFVYLNKNQNLAINVEVLAEFRKITKNEIVWSRSGRCWEYKDDLDDSNSRMTE